MVRESGRGNPGTQNVLARLSELIFVEAIRSIFARCRRKQLGWLAGLRDPIVGRALEALHAAPRDPWTVESLGRTVGRVPFGAGGTIHRDGRPSSDALPDALADAARLSLLHEGQHVIAVAEAMGYESESAFSRVFKKLMGVPPATWRRGAGPR